MKYLLFILIVLMTSCLTTKINPVISENYSFKEEVNKSIIDGFFDGDTTNINNIYLLR